MESAQTLLKIGETEYEVPESATFLGDGNLYHIPMGLLKLDKFEILPGRSLPQPRRLVANEKFNGVGLHDDEIANLAEDIRTRGLDFHLLARWKAGGDSLYVAVYDGDRRLNAIELLHKNKAKCFCRKSGEYRPVEEVYGTLPCRVNILTDEQAWKLMWNVQDSTKAWGDGVPVVFVKICRENGMDDDAILNLADKKAKWLQDMDELCQLDEGTFSFLAEGLITTTHARMLLHNIDDPKERIKWCKEACAEAVKEQDEEVRKIDTALSSIEEKIETKTAEIDYAVKQNHSESEIEELRAELTKLQKKAEKKKGVRDGTASKTPTARKRHFGRAAQTRKKKATTESDTPAPVTATEEKPEDLFQGTLSPSKIRKHLEVIESLIDNKDESYYPLETLQAMAICYRAILNGDENLVEIFERQKKVRNIMQKRKS